jgi:hypothetical protein
VKDEIRSGDGGPVPVRDLMQHPPAESVEPAGPAFELDGESWAVREAGSGSYGTGPRGTARLVALHFYRPSAPDRPVRELLIAAGLVAGLGADELATLFRRATPIELDRDQR